jgi:hypothetical protein
MIDDMEGFLRVLQEGTMPYVEFMHWRKLKYKSRNYGAMSTQ